MPADRNNKKTSPANSAGDGDVTFTEGSPSVRKEVARMKPESKAYQRRRLEQDIRRREASRDFVAADNPGDVVEISTDDDVLGSGPPWDIRPDDSLYRGRSGRSAVGTVQAMREVSPPNTRATNHRDSGANTVDSGQRAPAKRGVPETPEPRPRPRPTPRPKKPKSSPVVVSSDEDNPPVPPSSDIPSSASPTKRERQDAVDRRDVSPSYVPAKKARRAAPPPFVPDSLCSDEDLPSLAEILESMKAAKKKRAPVDGDDSDGAVPPSEAYLTRLRKRESPPPQFFDNEAMEENDDGESVHSMGIIDDYGDDYDYNDPFIDDSEPTRKAWNNLKEDELYERTSTTFNRRRLSVTQLDFQSSRNQTRIKEDPEDGPKPHMPAGSRSSDPTTPDAPAPKGKGKARVTLDRTPSPVPPLESDEEHNTDEEGLSAHELAEFREARRLSLLTTSARVGETGRNGSSSTSPSNVDDRSPKTPKLSAVSKQGKATTSAKTSKPSGPAKTGPAPAARPRIAIGAFVHRHAIAARRSGQSPPRPSPPQVTHEELSLERRCLALPEHDEVRDPSIQDVVLASSYTSNPNMRQGRVIAWTNTVGTGRTLFSAWSEQCPDMDGQTAYDAVTFVESDNIRNPSRTSPLGIALRPMLPSTTRFNVYVFGPPATPLVAFSTGFVEFSQLVTPSTTGLRQRFIRLVFHTQEWEAFEAFLREITDLPEIHAQFARDALQFSTRATATPSSTAGGAGSSTSQSRSLRTSPQKMFQSRPTAAGNRILADNFSLPNDVVVPVYDARRVESFDFNTDLHRLQRLPLFHGEIPYGSFAGVGYTMTIYRASNGNWTVGCNIQWVLLIGTPTLD